MFILISSLSEKAHYELVDLQNKIGATISLFPNIKDAKVIIALGEDNRYVLNNADKTAFGISLINKLGFQKLLLRRRNKYRTVVLMPAARERKTTRE